VSRSIEGKGSPFRFYSQGAKALEKSGIHPVLVQQAGVGDAEDLEYIQFLVGGMTMSKASSAFKFSGPTGSTNGQRTARVEKVAQKS
jgi:hypothetical protein